jgi:ABC-type nitrate/sulfonate/bicarbonate transport system substrate-binding protein
MRPRARSGRAGRAPAALSRRDRSRHALPPEPPDETFQLFIEGRPELNDELNRRAWQDTLPRFALRPAAMDTARYARFANFLEDQGLIKTPPPVEDYAVELQR